MSSFCIITTTFHKETHAKQFISLILEEHLGACAQMMPVQSFYRWDGKLCDEKELLVLIKTQKHHYDAIEELILKHHPYDTPQLLQIPIEKGLTSYLAWLEEETRKS